MNDGKKFKYLGCFKEDWKNKDLSGLYKKFDGAVKMTTELCLRYCADNSYLYAATRDGEKCTCGDSYGKHGEETEFCNCDKECEGAQNETCGGKDSNSVYEILCK